jgi:hypothetical protein
MADSENTGTDEGLKEVERLKTQLQNWQAKATDYERRFAGIDPDRVKADRQALEQLQMETAKGDDKKIDELLKTKEKDLTDRFSGKLTEYEQKLLESQSELKKLRVTNVAMGEAASIFNSDALELIQSRVEADCDYQEGEIVIKGADGKPLASKIDPRKNMGVKEYLTTLAEKYPSCAKAQTTSGGKSEGHKSFSGGDYGTVTLEKYATMTEQQRAQLPSDIRGKLAQEYFRQK